MTSVVANSATGDVFSNSDSITVYHTVAVVVSASQPPDKNLDRGFEYD